MKGFNLNNFTTEQLQAARIASARPNRDCIDAVLNNTFGFASHVTQATKDQYIIKQLTLIKEIEAGKADSNFTIRQRMEYFLTGTSTAFLP